MFKEMMADIKQIKDNQQKIWKNIEEMLKKNKEINYLDDRVERLERLKKLDSGRPEYRHTRQ